MIDRAAVSLCDNGIGISGRLYVTALCLFLREVDARSSTRSGSTTVSSAPSSGQARTCWAVPTRARFNSTNQVEGMPLARQRGWSDRVFGCGCGGGGRLGWVGDLGFGGGSGGCCVGSWSCVVFAGAVGCRGGSVGVVCDVDVVVEQDRGLAADAGRFGSVRQRLR